MRLVTCFQFFLIAACLPSLSAQPFSKADLQTLFTDPAAIATKIKQAPTLDRSLKEEAWKAAGILKLGFSDANTPGTPKNWTNVRLVSDAQALYVSFDCREVGSIITRASSPENVPADDHVMLLLPTDGRDAFVHIKVNSRGIVWSSKHEGLDPKKKGKTLSIEGLEASARRYPGRWAAEVKVPFAGLFADLKKMPTIWKANFARKRHSKLWSSVKPTDIGYANWTLSWKTTMNLAVFKPDPDLFGVVYVPAGKVVPSEVKSLKPGTAKTEATVTKTKTAVPDGFKLDPAALSDHLRGPVALVAHVAKGPALKGDLSDPIWQKAMPLNLQYLDAFIPGEVEKNRTNVRILTDDRHLYLGFDCQEDFMKEIMATQKGLDPGSLWRDDTVELFIDPGRTESNRYFQIIFNSNGAYTKRRMKNDLSWDPQSLAMKTWRGDESWSVEIRISFADLGIKSGAFPKWWGANFFRVRWARRPPMDETPGWMNWDTAWRPNVIGTPHLPEMFGHLYFQKGDVVGAEVAEFLRANGQDLKSMGLALQKSISEGIVEKDAPRPPKPEFASKPRIESKGKEVSIHFAVKAPTDVAVWIEDAQGKTVRHLACGRLGKNAPAPMKPDSLEQSLVWNGKDNEGNDVDTAGCKVKVGLGLRGKFERVIGWKPGVSAVRSLATTPNGELIVFTGGHSVDHGWANSMIRVFGGDGQYKRQLYPFPNNLPAEKMAGLDVIPQPDGTWLPVIYQALNHSWFPESPAVSTQQAAVTPDGKHILMSNMSMRGMGQGRRLLKIGTDGSVPEDYLGPHLTRFANGGEIYIAAAPDGKTIYATGLRGTSLWGSGEYHNVVYRLTWDAPPLRNAFRKPFIGEFQTPSDEPGHLNDPRDIAVDAQGNIIVADMGNDRIAAFKPNGDPLVQIPLPNVARVDVHPKTGAIYAAAKKSGQAWRLVKFSSLARPTVVAEASFRVGRGVPAMALDSSTETPVIWLSAGEKFADLGDRFEHQGILSALNRNAEYDNVAVSFTGNLMYVDKDTDEIYAGKYTIFDGKSGRFLRRMKIGVRGTDSWGGEIRKGHDGNLYLAGANDLQRFAPDGKRLEFDNGKKDVPKLFGGHGNSNRGHCVAPNGDIYFVHHYAPHGNTQVTLSQVSTDGTIKRYQFINNRYTSGSGVRVDRQGNVYMGLAVKPREEPYPNYFRGRLPTDKAYPHPWFFYRQMYGAIVKFKPSGGQVVKDANGEFIATNYSHFHRCRIEGAEWVHYGYSPMHQKDIQSSRCNCESARFDLDDFGRLWIPDAMRSSIKIIDSNGNQILRLGGYGNMDARGPGSPAPKPEIAMAWPLVVYATDNACYIADTVNRRIVKAALGYEALETSVVK